MEGEIDAGREVEVTSDEEGFKGVWYTCIILKLPENKTKGKALVQYKTLLEEDNQTPLTENIDLSFIRPLPPEPAFPADQCFQLKELVDAFHLDGWWTGSVSQVLDNPRRYIVSFADPPEEIEFSSSNLRPHRKWVNGKWVKPSQFQVMAPFSMPKFCFYSFVSVAFRMTNHGKDFFIAVEASKEPAKSKQVKRATPEGDDAPLHPSKKFKHGSLAIASPLESEMKDGVGLCKKYGRKLKCHVGGPKHLDAGAATEVQKVTKEVESLVTGGLLVECGSVTVTEEYRHATKEEMILPKEHDMGRPQKEDSLHETKNENPKSLHLITQSPSVDINDAAGVLEECKATKVESSMVSGSQTMSTDGTDCPRKIIKVAGESGRTLHKNEEQSQLICCENGSEDFPPGFENPQNDTREKPRELMVQSPLVGLAGDNESDEGPNLPFVKTLQVWKVVESMDVFKAMPQSPHFHPLVESKKLLREGLAVGHMLNFASLVEKTSKLTVADPENLFTSILDALPDFRNLGFDVEAVRDRASELLLMKDRHEHLQHSSKDVELKLKQCSDELTKIKEEIDVNSKMLRELKEKQASLLSKKTSNISQMTSLQACVDVTTKDIQIVEAEFESLARSTW
ncbi:hypothetical protein V6N12_018602 [Hibiscus sabdariffa]|uniref:Agenet domain-containing protein n=1 Tax=Hibiscus sabdariffa TaxID=183260 RepID=A0ABR1Z6E2_9ROSI